MYLRLQLKCACGCKFEIDTTHTPQKSITCPSCGKKQVDVSDDVTVFKFLQTAAVLNLENFAFEIRKISLKQRA